MAGRIRALHLFHQYLKGTENWAFHLINNLPDTEIVIASNSFDKCSFYNRRFEYLEFPVKRIEQNQDKFAVRIFNKVAATLFLLFYKRYVQKMVGKVDLIHSHFSFIGYEYLKLARRLKVPHIVSFYGFDYEYLPYNSPIWKRRYGILFEQADLILCEGSYSANTLKKIGCPEKKIRIAKLGVEIKKIPFRSRTKKSGELKLLQVASLAGKKGHIYTVKALIKSLWSCPNLTLTIVGKNYEGTKEKIEEVIKENNIVEKVSFLDWIDFESLHEFMFDYHVFIHPSCYTDDKDCEGGVPVVLMDAHGTGMPIISTMHCDIPDVVKNNETGFLTMEKDIDGLSKSIERFYLMENSEYQKFCVRARKHVEAGYDIEKNGNKVKEIYDEIAGDCQGKGKQR